MQPRPFRLPKAKIGDIVICHLLDPEDREAASPVVNDSDFYQAQIVSAVEEDGSWMYHVLVILHQCKNEWSKAGHLNIIMDSDIIYNLTTQQRLTKKNFNIYRAENRFSDVEDGEIQNMNL